MDKEVKERLVSRFRAYLDSVELTADSVGSSGGERPAAPDLFTMLAEVAALKNDVKLQSRQFRSTLEELRALFDTLRDRNADQAESRQSQQDPGKGSAGGTRESGHQEEMFEKGNKDLILELLELRDRLQAGHDQAARFKPQRRAGRAAASHFVASMAEGMAMNLRRLDDTLARRDVRPFSAFGQEFDPHTMVAAEQTHDLYRAQGRVVQELRPGYWYRDRLLRAAEVVVNRRDAGRRKKTRSEQQEEADRLRVFFSQWSQV